MEDPSAERYEDDLQLQMYLTKQVCLQQQVVSMICLVDISFLYNFLIFDFFSFFLFFNLVGWPQA